jgi:penicillin amidase
MRALVLSVALLGCTPSSETVFTNSPSVLVDVEESERWQLEGLSKPVMLVYTDGGVPHLYAENRTDLSRAMGFTVARDRFFQMDLVRRLATGRLSAFLGDSVLELDLESRGIAMTYGTDVLLENFTPEQRKMFTAYAEGYNDYIDAVRAGDLPAPSEYELAKPLLGVDDVTVLMEDWTLRDVAAIGGTILYRLGYETGDIGNTAVHETLMAGVFEGADDAALRQAFAEEIYEDVTPVYDVPSAPGFGVNGQVPSRRAAPAGTPVRVNDEMLQRASDRFERLQNRLGRDHEEGWGSNAWAVDGAHSADGRALLAGDGHLELDIPALMYQIGLDTAEFGDGEITQKGLILVGMPVLSVGTNGHVAWSTTQHSGDITDWYAEELQLSADGAPSASLFQGVWEPLVETVEAYEIAEILALGSVGRTETWSRWTTFDGRWITDIEGRSVDGPDAPVESGEQVVNLTGSWVVPSDQDGDGVITAISFDFTGLDKGNLFEQWDALGTSRDVAEVKAATAKAQALSQNLVAADTDGGIFYSGYEMVPCRGYLPRDADGRWIEGANPTRLLDGTTYGGFEIPVDAGFEAVEGDVDPYRCVVPFEDYPHSFAPEHGTLLTANQDPGGLESDGDLSNDLWYIGGPWDDGYRAEAIDRRLGELNGAATLADMAAIQGYHGSALGRRHVGDLLEAIDAARSVQSPAPDSSEARLLALYEDHQERVDEVYERLEGWAERGYEAASGVETFYHPSVDAAELDDAVATMIFNVWMGDLARDVLDDEGLPSVWRGGGTAGRLRVLHRMFRDRGPGTEGSAGWNPATEESIFFDDRSTAGLTEESDEVALGALIKALDFLESEPTESAEGGFGTAEMDAWIWGYRHQAEFKSLVGAYIDDPLIGSIFAPFGIDTDDLPLADLQPGDPRHALEWFPRPADNRCIDAGNNGLSGRSFRHGSGPVMRMAFALGPEDIEGINVIPGGQSGILESEHYDDQLALWLANDTLPLPITVDEVVDAAVTRVTFHP